MRASASAADLPAAIADLTQDGLPDDIARTALARMVAGEMPGPVAKDLGVANYYVRCLWNKAERRGVPMPRQPESHIRPSAPDPEEIAAQDAAVFAAARALDAAHFPRFSRAQLARKTGTGFDGLISEIIDRLLARGWLGEIPAGAMYPAQLYVTDRGRAA